MIKKLLLTSTLGLGVFNNAQTVVFTEKYEPTSAALWQNIDSDGHTEKWEFLNAQLY